MRRAAVQGIWGWENFAECGIRFAPLPTSDFSSGLCTGFLYAFGLWTAATLAGLAIVAREIRTASVKIIDLTSLGFFVLALTMLLTVGGPVFNHYHIIMVWAVFAVVTWTTILIGFPFTLQLARESAGAGPRESGASRHFIGSISGLPLSGG
jgi:hypothetical protein